MTQKVWFITGTSRGFGKLWTEAALKRGDKVVATARNPVSLDDLVATYGDALLVQKLDVTDNDAVVAAVAEGHRHFDRLDVIVANAGYGATGALEEIDFAAARDNIATNVLGTLSLVKAALPYLRQQGSGHIIPISSGAGLIAFPTSAVYSATKFAVNGMADALSQEVAQFGIKVTIVEPGPFATDFSGDSLVAAPQIEAYAPLHQALAGAFDSSTFPDPAATIAPLLRLVDMEQPPLHLHLGTMLPMIEQVYAQRLETLRTASALYP